MTGTPASTSLASRRASADVAVASLERPLSLAGSWRQRVGDDLRWAQSDYDDASWTTVRTTR